MLSEDSLKAANSLVSEPTNHLSTTDDSWQNHGQRRADVHATRPKDQAA